MTAWSGTALGLWALADDEAPKANAAVSTAAAILKQISASEQHIG